MNIKRFLAIGISMLLLGLSAACEHKPDDPGTAVKEGIRLTVHPEKPEFAPDEEVAAILTIENTTGQRKAITIPRNGDPDAIRIAAAAAQHEREYWPSREWTAEPLELASRDAALDGWAVYDLEPEETLRQRITWDQQVEDVFTVNGEPSLLPAPSGTYTLHASVILGEMKIEEGASEMERMLRFRDIRGNGTLADLSVQTVFRIGGSRDLISPEEALAIIRDDAQANAWYEARTFDGLTKREASMTLWRDRDGEWVEIEPEQLEKLRGIAPMPIESRREANQLLIRYDSAYGGPPKQMVVVIDTASERVMMAEFYD